MPDLLDAVDDTCLEIDRHLLQQAEIIRALTVRLVGVLPEDEWRRIRPELRLADRNALALRRLFGELGLGVLTMTGILEDGEAR